MDKVMDSGSIDAGSIPVRDASKIATSEISEVVFSLKVQDKCNGFTSKRFTRGGCFVRKCQENLLDSNTNL